MELSPAMSALIFLVVLICIAFLVITVYLVIKIHRRKPEVADKYIIGSKGKAITEITKESGQAFVNGTIWEATCENEPLNKGEKIIVISVDGLDLVVGKKES